MNDLKCNADLFSSFVYNYFYNAHRKFPIQTLQINYIFFQIQLFILRENYIHRNRECVYSERHLYCVENKELTTFVSVLRKNE